MPTVFKQRQNEKQWLSLLVLLILISMSPLYGATITWTNGGGDGTWSNSSNWSTSTVPTSSDDVIFDGTSVANATLDVATTIKTLTIDAGYTGQVSLSSQTLTISSNLTTDNASQINAGTSTVIFSGSKTVNCPASLYNLTINSVYNNSIIFGQNLEVLNDLLLTYVNNMNGDTLKVHGDIVSNTQPNHSNYIKLVGNTDQTISGSGDIRYLSIEKTGGDVLMPSDFTFRAGQLRGSGYINTTGVLNITNGYTFGFTGTVDDLNINSVYNNTVSFTQNLTVNDSLILTAVNNMNGDTLKVHGDIVSNTQPNHSNYIKLVGNTDQTISGSGDIRYLSIEKTGGDVLMPSDFTFRSGQLRGSGYINTTGVLNITNGYTFGFTGTVDDLNINSVYNNTVSFTQNLTVNDSLILTAVNNMNGDTLKVHGDIVSNTQPNHSNYIKLVGNTNQTISGSGDIRYLSIEKTGGDVLMPSDFTLRAGQLRGSGYINTTGVLNITNGYTFGFTGTVDDLNINSVYNNTVSFTQNLTVNDSLILTAVNNMNGDTLKVHGDIVSNTQPNHSNYIKLVGNTNQTISGSGDIRYLSIEKTGGDVLMPNDFTFRAGQLRGSGYINTTGVLNITNGYTFGFTGTVDDLNINSVYNNTVSFTQNLTVNDSLILTAVNNMNGDTLKVHGDIVSNTQPNHSNYIKLVGNTNQTISGSGNIRYLSIEKTGGDVLMPSDFTFRAGQLRGSGYINTTGVLNITNGYTFDFTGTVDDLNINSVYNNTVSFTQNLTVNDSLILTAVNNMNGDTLKVHGDIISNTTPNHSNYIKLVGSTDQTISGGGSLMNISIEKTGGDVLMPSDFTFRAGQLRGSGYINTTGVLNITNGYTFDFTGTVDDLNINSVYNNTVSFTQNLTVNDSLILTAVNNMNGDTLKVHGDIVSNTQPNHSNYIKLVGNTDQTISGSGNIRYLSIEKTGGDVLMPNDFTFRAGQLRGSGYINTTGVLNITNGYTFDFTGTVDDLNINSVYNNTVSFTQNLTVNDSLILTAVNNMNGDTLKVHGDIISNTTPNHSNYIKLVGSTDQTISGGGSLMNISIEKTGGDVLMPNDFTFRAGQLRGSGYINTTGVLNITNGYTFGFTGTVDDLNINSVYNNTVSFTQNLTVNDSLILTAVNNMNGDTLKVHGDIVSNTQPNHSNYIKLVGNTDQTISGSGNIRYLSIEKTGGDVLMPSDFTFRAGQLRGSGYINTTGVLNITNGYTFDFTGTVDDLNINSVYNNTVSFTQNLTVNDSLILTAVNNMNGDTLKVHGDIISNTTPNHSNYIKLVGSTDQTISGTGSLKSFAFGKPSGNLLFDGSYGKVFTTFRVDGYEWDVNGETITATNFYIGDGATIKGSGTLTGNLIVENGGILSLGSSPGCVAVTGNYTLQTGGTHIAEIGGTTACTDYDQLQVGGAASLVGDLEIQLLNGFTPNSSNNFDIITSASRSGTFGTITPPVDYNGNATYNANGVILGVVSTAVTVEAGTDSACVGEDVIVPINVGNGNGVGSFSFRLDFDNTKLQFTGHSNIHTGLNNGNLQVTNSATANTNGYITMSWIDGANINGTDFGDSKLLDLGFSTLTVGTANLTWNTTGSNGDITDGLGNALGLLSIDSIAYAYALPTPTIVANDTSVCLGETVTFTAGGGASYEFFINGISQGAASATNTFATNSLVNGDEIDVYVTNANGCIDSSTVITMSIFDLPTAGLTSSDADNSICIGDAVTFTGTGGVSYEFKLNGTTVQAASATDTYTTSALANSDAVTVVVTNANGCIATSSAVTTTVKALPTAGLTSSDADNTICIGDAVTFTGTGGVSYEFKLNGTTVQAASATATYTTSALANSDAVTVVVTNANGCIATSSAVTTTVNALPTAGLTSSDADNSICIGDAVTFTGTGGVSYEFKLNGTTVQAASATDTYTTSALANSDAVTVVVTNANGCIATSSAVTTTVNALPTAGLTSSDADNSICIGDAVTFTGTGGVSYEFKLNGTTVQAASATDTYTTSALANSDAVTVVVTNANGCIATSSAVTTTVNALPTAGLTSSDADNTICIGDAVTFTGTGGVAYEFKLNGTTVQAASATDTYTTSALANSDAVTVVVTNANGCIATSSAVTTTVNALPTAGITSDDADNAICLNETVTFTGTGGVTYEFLLNGTSVQAASATDTYTTSTLADGDAVRAVVTNANGCIDTSSAITTIVRPLPIIQTVNGGGDYCPSGSGTVIGLAGSEVGVSYQLILNGSVVETITGTGSAINFSGVTTTNASGDNYSVAAFNSTNTDCTSDMNGSATVTLACFDVTMNLIYDNGNNQGLKNTPVVLYDNAGTQAGTGTTNTTGQVTFQNVVNGTGYYIAADLSSKPFDGVNGTDALLTMLDFSGHVTLTGLKKAAADVDNSSMNNATDALEILKRYVGNVHNFSGDWLYDNAATASGFDVNGANVTETALVLTLGDVNGSYDVSGLSNGTKSIINVYNEGELHLQEGTIIDIPFYTQQSLEAGAVSLVVSYPYDVFDIEKVTLNKALNNVIYEIKDGRIRLSWFSLQPIQLEATEALFTITAKVHEDLAAAWTPTITFGNESELANGQGQVIGQVNLTVPTILLPQQNVLEFSNTFQQAVYPNPAQFQTSLEYNLPTDALVTVALYDAVGREVTILSNETQSKGIYTLMIDTNELGSGLYTIRTIVQTKIGIETYTEQLMISK